MYFDPLKPFLVMPYKIVIPLFVYAKLTDRSVFLMDRFLALEDFKNRITKLHNLKYRGRITRPSYYLGKNFNNHLEKFIDDLTIDSVQSNSFHIELNIGLTRKIINRIRYCVKKQQNLITIPILTSDKKRFKDAYNAFSENIFNDLGSLTNYCVTLAIFEPILDSIASEVLSGSKFIYVIRDPRDVFVTAKRRNNSWMIGNPNNSLKEQIETFIKIYKLHLRDVDFLSIDNRCLIIRFEELINSYDTTVSRIVKFTGIPMTNYVRKLTRLIPTKSSKTIGIYKEMLNLDQIALLNRELLVDSIFLREYINFY